MLDRGRKYAFVLTALILCGATARAEILISGRIVSSQGQELPGAQISLSATRDPFIQGELVRTGALRETPLASTRSTAGGHFQLGAPTPGLYTVVVESPGFLPWEYPLALIEPTYLPTVALSKATEHRVRVVDGDGQAIPGALATVAEASRWSRQNAAFGAWLPASQLARSSEAGQLTFHRETVRGVDLLVWAPGYVESETPSGKTGSNEARLHRGVQRVIEIRNGAGEPAPGTLVRLGLGRWPAGSTDADGRLSLAAPADRSLRLELVTAEGRTTTVSLLPPTATTPLSAAEVFYLQRREIEGRVVGATDGEPLAGALLWAGGERGVYAWTGPRGGFSLPNNQPTHEVKLFVEAPHHLGQRTEGLSVNGSGAVELALQPAATLPGRIVDEDEHPVANAELQIHTDLSRNHFLEPPLSVAARSDADGRFQLSRLPDAPLYELIARAPGFAALRFSITPPVNDREIVLVLGRGRTTVGSVRDIDGRPVANAAAVLYPSRSSQRDRLLVDDVHVAQSLVDGSFTIPHVVAGRYELGVTAPGHAPMIVRGLDVLQTAEPLDLGTVFLEPEAILVGQVTDPRGQPLEGVSVSFLSLVYEVGPQDDQLSTMKVTSTDREGKFLLTQLAASEPIDLQLRRRGHRSQEILGIEVPAVEPLVLVLEPVTEITGRVVDPDGEAVASAQVVMRPQGEGWTGGQPVFGADQEQRSISTNARGWFTLETVDPGLYGLTATAQGYLRSDEVEVEIGNEIGDDHPTDALTLVLGRGARLAGRILAPDGRPVTGARLRVTAPAPQRSELAKEATTRSDGSYELAGLEAGPTTVEIVHRQYPREVRQVELRAEVQRLDVTLDDGFEIAGRVMDDSRAPMPGVNLRLEGSGQARRSVLSDVGGDFHFTGVPTGTYRIRATKDGYAETRAEVRLDDTGLTDGALELELTAGGVITGRLVGLEANELARVEISARRADGTSRDGTVDFEGNYRLEYLAAGDWKVDASIRGKAGRRVSRSVALETGAPETFLDLDFDAGLVLSGEIVHGGKPVAGALVALVPEDLAASRGDRSGQDGHFRLTGLETGIYQLTIDDPKTGLAHRQILELDTDHELVVELEPADPADPAVDPSDGRGLAP